jgi:branched-chain amino acid transport system permease protein
MVPARGKVTAEALPIGIFLVLVVLPLIAMATGGGYLVSLGARVMIFAVAAVALDLLLGFGGLISFGHAAFIGLGAYAVGILAAHGISDVLIALPGGALSALFALLTGIVCLHAHAASTSS